MGLWHYRWYVDKLHLHHISGRVVCIHCVSINTKEVMDSMFLFWSPFLSIVTEINKAKRRLIHFHRLYMDQYSGIFTARKELGARSYFQKRVSRILFTGGSAPLHAGIHSSPPRYPRNRHPPGPEAGPQLSAYWEIPATSGWYASYRNAILLYFVLVRLWSRQRNVLEDESDVYHTAHVLKWISILFLFRKMDRGTVK